MDKHIETYSKAFDAKLNKVIGYTDVDLEGRFDRLRSQETNLGNWITDIVFSEYEEVDICLINSGTLRYNSVIPKGPITARMIMNMLPWKDTCVILKVPGRLIMSMLENSVSAYPKLDGRWACYSGIKFAFDPAQPAGSRVHSVKTMNDEAFDFDRDYNIATKHFISLGRDGYDCFKDPGVSYVRDEEGAALIGSMVLEQMRRFGPSYSKNPIDMAIEYAINPSHVERRQLRMKMLHTNEH